jgi:predicted DNA-binding transcriptional regulator AlpA
MTLPADSPPEAPKTIKLLNTATAAAFAALDENTFRRLVDRGLAPQPVVIGARVLRWRDTDIQQWLASLPSRPSPGEGFQ